VSTLLLAIASLGCATRQVDVTIYDDHSTQVELRGYERRGEAIDRDYNHPTHISAERVSHIVSAIEVRVGDKSKHTLYPIVTGQSLPAIASAVSQALGQADSSQMVIVKTVRKNKRFGVFTRKHLTSFIIYVTGDYFHVKVSRINWELPRDPKAKIPEPRLGEEQMEFRVLAGDGMHSASKQTVAARWRDPIFETARRSLDRTDSGARTRTILLEEAIPLDELGRPLPEHIIDRLSPETLRQLADLEELRRQGAITEGEYARRRQELLGAAGR